MSRRLVPVLPAPRTRAMLLLWNPDAGLRDVAAVVQGDPSLTAQVIRAANSAALRPVDRIVTARDAVVRLGFEEVRRLLGAAVAESQFRGAEDSPLDAEELWRYSLATAVIAEALAAAPDRPLAFTAGLLHDLGRLALDAESPSRYEAVVLAVRAGVDQLAAEQRQFGLTHASLGAVIAEDWCLPQPLGDALANHHGTASTAVGSAVAIARLTVIAAGFSEGFPGTATEEAPVEGAAALEGIGGVRALAARIRWYRESLGG